MLERVRRAINAVGMPANASAGKMTYSGEPHMAAGKIRNHKAKQKISSVARIKLGTEMPTVASSITRWSGQRFW